MHGAPGHVVQLRLAIDGVTENIKHPRKHTLADRGLHGRAHILHHHTAGQTLRGGQGDAAHMPGIRLGQHLDDNASRLTRVEQRVNRRQAMIKARLDDTPAHGDDLAVICRR
jgi:hypothetical protein